MKYAINGPDNAHRKREALMAVLESRKIDGADSVQDSMNSRSMMQELSQLDQYLRSGVE